MKVFLKKLIGAAFTLFAVSLLVFLVFDIIPGDPAATRLGLSATPERLSALREEMGLNRPLPVRYLSWAAGFLNGDIGTSYSYGIPVSKMIGGKLPISITMTILAFLIMVIVSVPVAIMSARHEGGVFDRIFTLLNHITMALPPFFLGIILTVIFGFGLKIFTPGNYIDYKSDFGGFIRYLIFPATALALPRAAMSAKLLRASIIEQKSADYVRSAICKGNTETAVMYRHILRNAIIPSVTFWGMALADITVSSIIIEQVFNVPGLGRILLTSIGSRDYPVVAAIIAGMGFWVVIVNILVDIIYRLIDPRVR